LYRRHYDQIFRYCVHRLFNRQTAEDTTSVVFLKAVENFGRFKGTERQFRNWLFKIATNAINSHLRKTARRNGLLERFRPNNDSRKIEDGNDSKLAVLEQAMLSLKPKYQAIITLRFFENLKLTEIAEVTGRSPGTVRSQMARALAQMRKKIDFLPKEA
jgi:RNA polymerase sigma-70 factor (ECF subfamily)